MQRLFSSPVATWAAHRRPALLRERAAHRAERSDDPVQSRPLLRAVARPGAGGGDLAPRGGAAVGRSARATEPGARGRIAGPLRRGRDDRSRRPAGRGSGRQRHLSAADAGAAAGAEPSWRPGEAGRASG